YAAAAIALNDGHAEDLPVAPPTDAMHVEHQADVGQRQPPSQLKPCAPGHIERLPNQAASLIRFKADGFNRVFCGANFHIAAWPRCTRGVGNYIFTGVSTRAASLLEGRSCCIGCWRSSSRPISTSNRYQNPWRR